jgi:hypothetical protein
LRTPKAFSFIDLDFIGDAKEEVKKDMVIASIKEYLQN